MKTSHLMSEISYVNCCKCNKYLGLIVLYDDKPLYFPNGVLHSGRHSEKSINKVEIAANEDGGSDSVIFMYCDDCRKKEHASCNYCKHLELSSNDYPCCVCGLGEEFKSKWERR